MTEQKLDKQIEDAVSDIETSHKIIAGLQTLDKIKFPFIDSMIKFHEIRIKNCSDAIQLYYKKGYEKKLKRIETELNNLKELIIN